MAELTYEEIKSLLINVAGRMDYDELKDFHGEVTELLRIKSYAKGYGEGFTDGKVEAENPTVTWTEGPPYKCAPPLTRDEVVARAKADLSAMIIKGRAINKSGDERIIKFHINKKKRVVTALLIGPYSKMVCDRGIAKCAPNDCFNEYIGKAIALRRALGLEVPEEYTNAPEPEGVEVGDKVYLIFNGEVETVRGFNDKGEALTAETFGCLMTHEYKVIDDSERYKEGEDK